MDSINIESFLSITDNSNENIENKIKEILNQNVLKYKKLEESIIIIDDILKEEIENIDILKKELNDILLIHENAESLFSKIIEISKN